MSEAGGAIPLRHPRRLAISILLDSALRVAASDPEALALLSGAYGNEKTAGAVTEIPREFEAAMRAHYAGDDSASLTIARTEVSINVRVLNGSGRFYLVSLEPNDARDQLQHCVEAYALTRREEQVLLLILEGMRGYEIALELGISPVTVRDHCANLLRKTDTHSRWEMLAKLMRS